MTKSLKLLGLTVGLTILLVACGLYYHTLSGQIFIVTNGSENVKLGAVQITAYDSNRIKEELKLTLDYKDSHAKEEADLRAVIAPLEPAIDAAQTQFDQQKLAFDSIPLDSPQRDAASKAFMDAEAANNTLIESPSYVQLKKAQDDLSKLQASDPTIDSLGRYLVASPSNFLENVKSDADGHFRDDLHRCICRTKGYGLD